MADIYISDYFAIKLYAFLFLNVIASIGVYACLVCVTGYKGAYMTRSHLGMEELCLCRRSELFRRSLMLSCSCRHYPTMDCKTSRDDRIGALHTILLRLAVCVEKAAPPAVQRQCLSLGMVCLSSTSKQVVLLGEKYYRRHRV